MVTSTESRTPLQITPQEAAECSPSGSSVRLPEYAPLLTTRHIAHHAELRGIIGELVDGSTRRVLDVPCGDSFFSTCFADALPPDGMVVAADLSFEYLHAFQNCVGDTGDHAPICFVCADSYKLPFGDGQFDLAWCAQSLITLRQPRVALEEMRRVVHQGGTVVVLEEDPVQEMQMPWPVELEAALRHAEQSALDRLLQQHALDSNPALELPQLLTEAGLVSMRRTTYSIERRFPLPHEDLKFLKLYFSSLRNRLWQDLNHDEQRQLTLLIDPESDAYLPHQQEFEMRWQEIVHVGVKL